MCKLIFIIFLALGFSFGQDDLIKITYLDDSVLEYKDQETSIENEKTDNIKFITSISSRVSNLVLLLVFRNFLLSNESSYEKYASDYIRSLSLTRLYLKSNSKGLWSTKKFGFKKVIRNNGLMFTPIFVPQGDDYNLLGVLMVGRF